MPKEYLEFISKEVLLYQKEIQDYQFTTLYMGGGTPSLLGLKELEKFFIFLDHCGLLKNLKEITIEANPDSFDEEKAAEYKSFGINRISLGIQSFDDNILKKLGRLSDSLKNRKALEIAAKYFQNYSADLIYGIPGQNLKEELQNYLIFSPPHVSAYCLTIVEETPIFAQKKEFLLSDLKLNRQFYQIHEFFEKNGFTHYEISNYSKKGFESMHNLGYWEGKNYIGLGAGASGYLKNTRYINENFEKYTKKISRGVKPVFESESLTPENLWMEKWILGLRMQQGFKLFESKLPIEIKNLILLFKKKKWLEYSHQQIKPTLKGWTMLDSILKEVNKLS